MTASNGDKVTLPPLLAAERADGWRREGDRKVPLGAKARRTRDALLAAAYAQFSETGYRGTKVADICGRAGVSLGTFYQYFDDRADVMAALITAAVNMSLERPSWHVDQGREGARVLIRHYVEDYALTAAFQRAWEEATHVDDTPSAARRELGRYLTQTVERELRRSQRAGRVRKDLDAANLARALTAMVDRYCYLTYVFDPPERAASIDESADTLAEIWAVVLDLG